MYSQNWYIANHCLHRVASFFPLMNSTYNFNLQTAHKGHIFRFPWVVFIYRFNCTSINYIEDLRLTLSCLKWQSILNSRNTLFDETKFWNTLGIFFRATRFPSRGSVTDLKKQTITWVKMPGTYTIQMHIYDM